MNLTNELQVSDQAQHQRLIELESDGNQAFRSLVERDFITGISSFYMIQLPTGLVSLAVLADSEQAGESLWFDEIYSPHDSIQLVEKLVSGFKTESEEEQRRIASLGKQAIKWLKDTSSQKLPFKVIDGVDMDVGTILNSLRELGEE